MAREEITRIVLEGDSEGAVRATRAAGEAASDAGQDFDRLGDDIDEVVDDLERLDRTDVDIDVDVDGVDRAQRSTQNLNDTAQRGVGPLRGLTDEMGESAGAAGTMGNAFIDGGEAIEIFGAQAGLSQRAIGALSTGMVAAGAAAAAGAVLWGQFTASMRAAKERAKELAAVQDSLSTDNHRRAAEQLIETYGFMFDPLLAHGIDAAEVMDLITGKATIMDTAFLKYIETLSGPELATFIQQSAVIPDEFERAAVAFANNAELIDEVTVALGGTLEETEEVNDATAEYGRTGAASFGEVTAAIDRTNRGIDRLQQNIADQQSMNTLRDTGRATLAAIGEAFDMAGETVEEHTADVEAADDAMLTLRGQVLAYGQDVLNLPAEFLTEIDAKIRAGAIDEVLRQLERLTVTRTAVVNVVTGVTPGSTFIPGQGSQGDGPDGGTVIVPSPGTPPPNAFRAVVPVVQVMQVSEPRDVATALGTWARVNGAGVEPKFQ